MITGPQATSPVANFSRHRERHRDDHPPIGESEHGYATLRDSTLEVIRDRAKTICRTLVRAPAVIGGGILSVTVDGTLVPWSPVICARGMDSIVHQCLRSLPTKIADALHQDQPFVSMAIHPSIGLLVGSEKTQFKNQLVFFLLVRTAEAKLTELKRLLQTTIEGFRPLHGSQHPSSDKGNEEGTESGCPVFAGPAFEELPNGQELRHSSIFLLGDDARLQRPWHELAQWCRTELRAEWVFLAAPTIFGKCHKLRGMAGPLPTKLSSPVGQVAGEILAETTIRARETWETVDNRSTVSSAQEVLRITRCKSLWAFPVFDKEGVCIGSFAAAFVDEGHRPTAAEHQSFAAHLALSFRLLKLLRLASWKSSAQRYFFWKGYSGKRQAALLALVTLFLAVIPLPAPVKCSCQLEPVQLRYVPAPYEGLVQEVLVQPGSVVSEGQVIAKMDRRESDWQLAAKEAEAKQASKDHDAGLATGDTSAAQVAHLEMERLNVEKKLIQHQAINLEIRSPLSGVILTGDPRTLTGARVLRGQVLFETAPLDRLHVEVEIRPEHLARTRVHQSVTVRLDALPFRTFRGTILFIAPRAEIRQDRHVFVAQVELDNVDLAMRPGMQGTAKVHSGWRPLVVSWFERLANFIYGFLTS